MPSWKREGYWDTRDKRADPNRTHPDDLAHRAEIAKLVEDVRRAAGTRRGGKSMVRADGDWSIGTLLKWAEENQLVATFHFDGFRVFEEDLVTPEGETIQEAVTRTRRILREVRLRMKVPKVEMDRRLDQQFSVYNTWELRDTPYMMSAMQRAVRALGGVFRVTFEHKHNPGFMRRLNARRR